ncbi:YkvA family protein [Zymobacter palmae]|uniref:Uncharacterized conserved protein n=1 Tax=Zymobacter palmae TaxID=33074 RepID=A0A348HHG7_9GAMM|nr:YkvA family protein [Zymobacter palmae]BBG31069.1 uncharacterized conserved protein [Zymobacter palmae]
MSHQENDADRYRQHYSEEGFWKKLASSSRKAGRKALNPALRMYYSARDPSTPRWAKTTLYGALGYFISPIDAIPDLTPVLGYTDDIGVMAAATAVVAVHITKEHIKKAEEQVERWLGK